LNKSLFGSSLRQVHSTGWIRRGNAIASLTINGKAFNIDVEPHTPLLWAIRENYRAYRTKFVVALHNAAPAP
jgi:hypothetical protein